MKLAHINSDKSDARAIREYARANGFRRYDGKGALQAESLKLLALMNIYLQQRTPIKNKLHGQKVLAVPSKVVHKPLKRALQIVDRELESLNGRWLSFVKLPGKNSFPI